jgi:RimJ/RimL family protein N-acetyltransferase
MADQIPDATVKAIARSVFKEATKYGFGQLDMIRLVNELMDYCTTEDAGTLRSPDVGEAPTAQSGNPQQLPLTGNRLMIRAFDAASDLAQLHAWMADNYGRHFVLSSTSARSVPLEELVQDESNHLGIITTLEHEPFGALAYLDHDTHQRRAELRKLIGNLEYRGKGYADEATRLWLAYGLHALGLEKIYVSTLQANLGNIRLNEKVGFQVEGLLRDEVLIDGARHDVLRMGFCRDLHSPF